MLYAEAHLAATCMGSTGSRVIVSSRLQSQFWKAWEPGSQQISFGASQGVCPLTALSSHPSIGCTLAIQDQEPITFGQNTVSAVGSLLISGPGTCSPPQGFMAYNLSQLETSVGLQHLPPHLTHAL